MVWKLIGAVRLTKIAVWLAPEVVGLSYIGLKMSRSRWINENSILDAPGKRWIDENSILENLGMRWIDENSGLEFLGTRWIDENSILGSRGRSPGGAGIIEIVVLGSPPRVTSASNVASGPYPRPHLDYIF